MKDQRTAPPSLTNHSLPRTSLLFLMTMMYLIGVGLMTSLNMHDIKRIGDRVSVSVLADENDDDEEG